MNYTPNHLFVNSASNMETFCIVYNSIVQMCMLTVVTAGNYGNVNGIEFK